MFGRHAARLGPALSRRLLTTHVQPAATMFPEPTTPVPDAVAPLVDGHGRVHDYLRISLTERCNLRCQYCMPAEGVPLCPTAQLLSSAELARLARVFAALGVRKVRLTGGEPTLRRDLPDIIQMLKSLPGVETVGLTTNALVLTRSLPALRRAGLDALNVSLDTLRPERYLHMARRDGLKRVLAAIDLALQLDYRPLKINTVLMKGFNDDEICDFVEFTRDREVEVRFIEFMPFSGNAWEQDKLIPYRTALRAIAARYPGLQAATPRPHDTARVWQVSGHAGRVGFISSMTHAFCSSCNRLRLTADGNLKVCLFGSAEVSLRDALRAGASDPELHALVRRALRNKKAQHAGVVCCRHAEPQGHEEPAHDLDRGVAPPRAPPAAPLLLRPAPVRVTSLRAYSSLSHVDGEGRARMVDVAHKAHSSRRARAECALHVSGTVLRLLREQRVRKGDALTVAEVAGVLAAKRTADLIPLCHTLALSSARVWVTLPAGEAGGAGAGGAVRVVCEAATTARTGVEMEALTGAALAALTLYDMCKAADPRMRITDLRVTSKRGGKADYTEPPEESADADTTDPKQSTGSKKPNGPPKSSGSPKSSGPPNSSGPPKSSDPPADPKEPFAPVNFMHF